MKLLLILFTLFISFGSYADTAADLKASTGEAKVMINTINAVFKKLGTPSCEAIPLSGESKLITIVNRPDLFETRAANYIKIKYGFKDQAKVVPAGFPNAGSPYDRRIELWGNDTSENDPLNLGVIVEISCSHQAGVVVQTYHEDELIQIHWNVDTPGKYYVQYQKASAAPVNLSYVEPTISSEDTTGLSKSKWGEDSNSTEVTEYDFFNFNFLN